MGLMLFRVPATSATRAAYADTVSLWWAYTAWRDEPICADPYGIVYRRESDGVLFAAPGNGDRRITAEDVAVLAEWAEGTQLTPLYSDDRETVVIGGDTYSRVVEPGE